MQKGRLFYMEPQSIWQCWERKIYNYRRYDRMDGWNWKVSTVLGDDHEVWQLSY